MTDALIFITGASGGIGEALVQTVPWSGARVVGISRSRPRAGVAEHVEADLADPASWPQVAEAFRKELASFSGERVVLIQAHGTVDPLGFVGEVDDAEYATNVVVNAASPLVLGHLFISAVRDVDATRHLAILTSGAAKSVYPGWASYGASKAAVDQWVRNVGAEQDTRGGVKVLAVGPGTVDTGMQAQLRKASEGDFPKRQKFVDAESEGKLTDPREVAGKLWSLLDRDIENGSVVDLRELDQPE